MLVVGFPAGAFQANCYLLATAAGREAVIVDPGEGAVDRVEQALRERELTPVAVLATHGHFDHVYSAAVVADTYGVAVSIHPEDRVLLSDPLAGLGPELAAAFGESVQLTEPAEVTELDEGVLELAGLRITVDHVPGHTPGSVLFRVDSAEGGQLVLTGDTLFAGSVGRTDLPGGDPAALACSLRTKLSVLTDDTVVLPGHGPSSTIGQERRTNPFFLGPEVGER
ncbi:MBL fold metallo-hydrolase [Amycolatopsis cihanbeyliensis]|uniref:Glyoxylase-like metal-dependent hydrolase (Beta-lactamase superfamily II) n=1 Tax=Amycolatopsis cihanbeyliensis TaxID=1128664 RepID=A0A542DDU8_AMYCI|nr:MBL fold metallo-hydrolase [Amycolatopsis cihanbeyliensis]TQJ01247.1 glyoxylase-like metal-dependent hydrolase (beta-lactamase superfamily II) [Amycolatopsis cihanbeyliensis]